MQEIGDIFGIWKNSIREMSTDLDRGYDTVLAWRTRGRIPEDAWDAVISAARRLGHQITATDLLALNRTPKQRGRPAHKPRRKRLRALEA